MRAHSSPGSARSTPAARRPGVAVIAGRQLGALPDGRLPRRRAGGVRGDRARRLRHQRRRRRPTAGSARRARSCPTSAARSPRCATARCGAVFGWQGLHSRSLSRARPPLVRLLRHSRSRRCFRRAIPTLQDDALLRRARNRRAPFRHLAAELAGPAPPAAAARPLVGRAAATPRSCSTAGAAGAAGFTSSSQATALDGSAADATPLDRSPAQAHGPNIPCMPGDPDRPQARRPATAIAPGARPCLDLIDSRRIPRLRWRGLDVSVIAE